MRLEQVEKKAYKLLDELKFKNAPILVDQIAEKLGIQIVYEPLDGDLSGVLYRDNNDVIIGVNSYHSTNRQRFTIAHEIGHFVLHDGNKMHVDREFRLNFRDIISSLAISREEIEANTFAAALLMPEHLIFKAVTSKEDDGIDIENDSKEIAELADQFKVSQQALLIRLGKLLN